MLFTLSSDIPHFISSFSRIDSNCFKLPWTSYLLSTMDKFCYMLLAFFSLASLSEGLKCNYCISSSSWENCDDGSKKVTCEFGIDRCIKMYAQATKVKQDEAFVKGCAKTCDETSIPQCMNGDAKCEINCCSGDYCNAGSSLSANAFVILMTAMGVIILLFKI